MKVGEFTQYDSKGDVYFFRVQYKEADQRHVLRIGGPEEADIRADSGMGKLVLYLLEHLGEFFDLQQLAETIQIKPITLSTYLTTLDSKFSSSKSYQMLSRGSPNQRVYALVDRKNPIEGNPVRKFKSRQPINLQHLVEFD